MMRKKKFLGLFLLIALLHSFLFPKFNFAQQLGLEEQKEKIQVENNQEKIIPSAKNIKESAGIYVFVAWMWVAIFVLIYILRLKIREVDRLYKIRFLSVEKK